VGKGKGFENLKDVFGILLQFKGVTGEGTKDGGRCDVPGNGLITMGLDGFGRFGASNGGIRVTNGDGDLVDKNHVTRKDLKMQGGKVGQART